MGFLKLFLSLLIQASSTMLIVYCILSWFISRDSQIWRWVASIVEPMLDPIRRIMPVAASLDFSPIVLMLLLQFLQRVVNSL